MMKFCAYFKDVTASITPTASPLEVTSELKRNQSAGPISFVVRIPYWETAIWTGCGFSQNTNALHKLYNEDICLIKVQLHAIARTAHDFQDAFKASHETLTRRQGLSLFFSSRTRPQELLQL